MENVVFNPFEYKGTKSFEKNSGQILVETAGYIPLKKQISNLLNAGQRLEDFRKNLYSNENLMPEEIDIDEEDLIEDALDGDVDIPDAMLLSKSLQERAEKAGSGHTSSVGGQVNPSDGIKEPEPDLDGSKASKEAMENLE